MNSPTFEFSQSLKKRSLSALWDVGAAMTVLDSPSVLRKTRPSRKSSLDEEYEQRPSADGLRVSEAEYWRTYYHDPDFRYEWNNGMLEEKPMADYLSFAMYRWFFLLLNEFLKTHPIATMIGLEIGFRLALPHKTSIRRPDLALILHTNPVAMASEECTYRGVFDLCIEFLSDSTPRDVTRDTVIKKAESPYGNTKQICEEILSDTVKAHPQMKAIALRYFNPIGAHDSGLIGELPRGVPANLVPFVTQTAIGMRDQLKVFGDDYNTPDGSCIRDYIHVVDLARAHVIAVDRLVNNKHKKGFEWFNLGTGKGASVLEIVNTFQEVTGIKIPYQIAPRRSGDVEQIWADTCFANDELGWKTERSLGDALASAWKWEQAIRKELKNG